MTAVTGIVFARWNTLKKFFTLCFILKKIGYIIEGYVFLKMNKIVNTNINTVTISVLSTK